MLSKGFKRSIFWNEYKSKFQTETTDNLKRILLDSSFQGLNRLFVATFKNTNPNAINFNSHTKYALPKINLTKFNVLIDGRNFYDQPISDKLRKYELRNLTIGKGNDYTTGSLLYYKYFKDHNNIIACDLSRQKELDVDPRSIQQIECNFMLDTDAQVLTILEKSKQSVLEFSKGTTKVL